MFFVCWFLKFTYFEELGNKYDVIVSMLSRDLVSFSFGYLSFLELPYFILPLTLPLYNGLRAVFFTTFVSFLWETLILGDLLKIFVLFLSLACKTSELIGLSFL